VSVKPQAILLVVVAVIALMILFPPWIYFDGNTSNQRSAGYHFLFSPPHVTTYEEMFGIAGDEVFTIRAVRIYINKMRLVVQILIVIFFGTGLIRRRTEPDSAHLGAFILGGLATAALILLLFTGKY
jgi:hypothetical protein